jgi:hypothetical protein
MAFITMSFDNFQDVWIVYDGYEYIKEVFGKYVVNGLITIEFKRDKNLKIIWRIAGTDKAYRLY